MYFNDKQKHIKWNINNNLKYDTTEINAYNITAIIVNHFSVGVELNNFHAGIMATVKWENQSPWFSIIKQNEKHCKIKIII